MADRIESRQIDPNQNTPDQDTACCNMPAWIAAPLSLLVIAGLVGGYLMLSPSVVSTSNDSASVEGVWYEARVNSFTKSTQSHSAMDVAADGQTVVVWDSRRQQKGSYGVYLQRYSEAGKPLGPETQVNLLTRGLQNRPVVSTDGQGGIWVAWESFGQDGSLGAVMARRFSAEHPGGKDFLGGSEVLVNEITAGQQSDVVVAGNSDGGATFFWNSYENGRTRVKGRQFDRLGKPAGSEFAISAVEKNQKLPTVARVDDRLMVAWAESTTSGVPTGVRAKVVDAGGKTLIESFDVHTSEGQHIEPSIDADEDGFAIAWLTAEGEEYAAYARRFNQTGSATSSAIRVTEKDANYVSGVAVAVGQDGQTLVSWNELVKQSSGRDINVQARFIKADDSLLPTFKINQHDEGRHAMTIASGKKRLATQGNKLLVAWNGRSEDDKSSVCLSSLVPSTIEYQLVATNRSDVSATVETAGAMPHEPPTYDAKLISDEAFGGDPNPAPGPVVDFGFIGITQRPWTPPDPSLAAGPDHLVGMTNGAIAFFDKNGNQQFIDEIEDNFGFWGAEGAGFFVFDPEVVYDPHSERFVAMANERTGGQSFFLLAVSDDSDPNGSWNKYRFNVTSISGGDIDSPNLAVDEQGIYLTADFFGPDQYLIFAIDKADVIAGVNNPSTENLLITGSQSYGLATNYDPGPAPLYMIQAFEFSTFDTVQIHAINDPLTNPSQQTVSVSVPAYGHPQDPPSQGTSVRPELFEARFWSCVYRDGSLWAVHHHSPNSTGTVRARWYEFDMNGWPASGQNPTLAQSGEIFPGAGIRTFFPSIWVDAAGNAAITCARSATNEFVSMSRAVRAGSDPAGTFQPIEFVRQSNVAINVGRWGDYSGTANDPASLGTFWGMHEYATGANTWNTWIARYELIASPEDVLVDNFNFFRGFQTGGDVSSLTASDDQYLSGNPGFTLNSTEPPVWIELEGVSPFTPPTDLTMTIESSANTPNISQETELFNQTTSQYELIDQRAVGFNNDATAQLAVSGDISRFVGAGGAIEARVGWRADGFVLLFPWEIRVDLMSWTVTP